MGTFYQSLCIGRANWTGVQHCFENSWSPKGLTGRDRHSPLSMKKYRDMIVEALISLYDKKVSDEEFLSELQDLVVELKSAKFSKTSRDVDKACDIVELLGRESEKDTLKAILESALRMLLKEAEGM